MGRHRAGEDADPEAGPVQDLSKAIALFEQLERPGVGMDPGSTARANAYLRRRARFSRNTDPTEADFAESAQYAAIADLAVRLADFAAAKGGADFAKGGAIRGDFDKGGADFKRVALISVPVSESLTATRSAPHGARLQVAPHQRSVN